MKRIYCGELSVKQKGEKVRLRGWVYRRRDHGGLIFIDLRDITGIVQVVFSTDISSDAHLIAGDIRQEFVIEVREG